MRALLLLALLVLIPTPAPAQSDDIKWINRNIWHDNIGGTRPYYRAQRRYLAHRQYYGPQVRGYVRRYQETDRHDHDDERSGWCLDTKRNVGDERLSEDKAKDAAAKAWTALVRFHHGEKFMDLNFAREVKYTCARSSVNDTFLGKAAEAVGQNHMRCEIEARPCKARKVEDEGAR